MDVYSKSWWPEIAQAIADGAGPDDFMLWAQTAPQWYADYDMESGDYIGQLVANLQHQRDGSDMPFSKGLIGDMLYKYEPTGGAESFFGGDIQPIDRFLNPVVNFLDDGKQETALDLGRAGGRAMAGYGIATGANAAMGAGAESAAAGGTAAETGTTMPAAVPETTQTLTDWGLTETSPGVWEAAAQGAAGAGAGSVLDNVMNGADAVMNGDTNLGSIFDGLSGFLPSKDTALALAPILAAIAYAQNQGGFNTGRLESTYDQFEPNAMAYEYDQNTLRGREGLTSSLTNRGVMGSSFGNMDIANFNTARDLGRRSLINHGLTGRGDVAKSILDAEIKQRALKNQLYGTSLLALGNVFGGNNKTQPKVGGGSGGSIFGDFGVDDMMDIYKVFA